MNRRTLFESLVGTVHKDTSVQPKNNTLSFSSYTGPWGFEQAAHLLRRTMFGPSLQQIESAIDLGLDGSLEKLLDASVLPNEGPVNPGKWRLNGELVDINDPYVESGDTWVKKIDGKWKAGIFTRQDENAQLIVQSRINSLRSWKTEKILKEGMSIYEKMTLFWHNHFVVSDVQNPFSEFFYVITLMENSLGNFRELTKIMTLDPAMMDFLNGNLNTAEAPNENYARELFELFTIGKGALAGPGDYTFYTEDDVRAAARVLTGWRISRTPKIDPVNGTIELSPESLLAFSPFNHDTGNKQFSHRFNNKVIENEGAEEYKALVNMIFEEAECARFICRKLYRWFVYYDISEEIELNIIEPMAQILINNNYEIKPALVALLKSEHFYDALNLGPMIKNPYDFVTSFLKPFDFPPVEPDDHFEKLRFYRSITGVFTLQQMAYFAPPDVAGWKAYYQAPLYYRTWINSSTLNFRMFITRLLALRINENGQDDGPGLDVLGMAAKIDNAIDPNDLINTLSKQLFPQPISQGQKDYLKAILLPGLPDFEWTVEYSDYLTTPNDLNLRNSVEQKLRLLVNAMLTMPEFYLS